MSSNNAAEEAEESLAPLISLDVEYDPRQKTPNASKKFSTAMVDCLPKLLGFACGVVTCPIWAAGLILYRLLARSPLDFGTSPSRRVKSVEFLDDSESSQSRVLLALYSGHVMIWNTNDESGTKPRPIFVSETPVRCVKYVKRVHCFVTASDDMKIRVFDIKTMEQTAQFEAHTDYIRSLEVHPTLPYLLSSSDDMTIKCWDMEYNYSCKQTIIDAHVHYVMQVRINPHDTNIFASASLDRTIKVWTLGQEDFPLYTLEGHDRGVNCLDFSPHNKSHLVSGSDDFTVKVWDLETKTAVHTLQGHVSHNITSVLYHPFLPILISASEDGTCWFWDSTTYGPAMTLNSRMERAWALAGSGDKVAIGCDDGCICIDLESSPNDNFKPLQIRNKRVLSLDEEKAAASNEEEKAKQSNLNNVV